VKLSESKSQERVSRLENEVSFGYITPTLSLVLSPGVGIDLGATFQTRRVKKEDQDSLLGARLWELPGAYGNTLFAGLNFSI